MDGTEELRTDAQVARDRSLQAIETTDDVEIRRSLWRAALRYQERVMLERLALGRTSQPLRRAPGVPVGATRELKG
jgi:hypothetical protein